MAEDQGVNGDRWTDEFNQLLSQFQWNKVADSNIDIVGQNGIVHGIDSMYWYEDGFDIRRPKGVFLEAKRYATTSFQLKKLEDWVRVLNNKIRSLTISGDLYNDYPEMEKAYKFNGLLAIWFHDIDAYALYKPKLMEFMKHMAVPRIRDRNAIDLNLYIIENDRILELSSMIDEIKIIKQKVDKFSFYYPSIDENIPNNSSVLNLEYMYSKFILAKGAKYNRNAPENYDYVFYYGEIAIEDFYLLSSALVKYSAISSENSLHLYIYKRNVDVFRKIKPDVEKIFADIGVKSVEISQLSNSKDLPNWMVNY